jgi:hypothetical protein
MRPDLRACLRRSARYGDSQEQHSCGSSGFHADVPGAIEQLFWEDGLIIVKAWPGGVEAILARFRAPGSLP